MNFDEISNQIWNEMANGAANEEPFTEDFISSPIDFPLLITYLGTIGNLGSQEKFDRSRFVNRIALDFWTHDPVKNSTDAVDLRSNNPYKYKDANQQIITAILEGRMNKRLDYIDGWGTVLELEPKVQRIQGSFRFHYRGAKLVRLGNDLSDSYNVEDKYVAVEITTTNLTHFCYIYQALCRNDKSALENIELRIRDLFAEKLLAPFTTIEELNFLYSNLPESVLPILAARVPKETLVAHLKLIVGFFKSLKEFHFDWYLNSSSIINILRILSSSGQDKIYYAFKDNPEMILDFYDCMSGSSMLEGIEQKNYTILASLLYGLCQINNFEGLNQTKDMYFIGEDAFPESHVMREVKPYTDKVFLRQYGSADVSMFLYSQTLSFPVTEGKYYHPLDLVKLVDFRGPQPTVTYVPAILVKAIADQKEWETIARYTRIAAGILFLILGAATLGVSSPILLTLALGDVLLTGIDVFVMLQEEQLMKTAAGKRFLQGWNEIVIAGGIAFALPALVQSVFVMGARLLFTVTKETREFVIAAIYKMALSNPSFSPVCKLLENTDEVYRSLKNTVSRKQIDQLREQGVVFFEDLEVVAEEQKKISRVVYANKVIAYGDAVTIKQQLKELQGLKGAELEQKLKALAFPESIVPKGRPLSYIEKINKGLVLRRKNFMKNGVINAGEIGRTWKKAIENRIRNFILKELTDPDIANTLEQFFFKVQGYYGKDQGKSIAIGKLRIQVQGKTYTFEHWANAGDSNHLIPPDKQVREFTPDIPAEQMEDVLKGNAKRINDAEGKLLREFDRIIAEIAQQHKVKPENLKIKMEIYSTFDPCTVCKRELLIRKALYKGNCTIEIQRPFYKKENGALSIVENSKQYLIHLQQKKL